MTSSSSGSLYFADDDDSLDSTKTSPRRRPEIDEIEREANEQAEGGVAVMLEVSKYSRTIESKPNHNVPYW